MLIVEYLEREMCIALKIAKGQRWSSSHTFLIHSFNGPLKIVYLFFWFDFSKHPSSFPFSSWVDFVYMSCLLGFMLLLVSIKKSFLIKQYAYEWLSNHQKTQEAPSATMTHSKICIAQISIQEIYKGLDCLYAGRNLFGIAEWKSYYGSLKTWYRNQFGPVNKFGNYYLRNITGIRLPASSRLLWSRTLSPICQYISCPYLPPN